MQVSSKVFEVFLLLSCYCTSRGASELFGGNTIASLRNELLRDYHPNARPVKDHKDNTTVQLGISANHIEVNDDEHTMIVVTYLIIMWKDEFLRWNPESYNNMTQLHFDTDEVWIPDVALYNSAKGTDLVPKMTLPVVVYSSGDVLWVPPFTAEVPCQLDLTYWPNDQHTCSMQFGSWAHHGEQINLKIEQSSSLTGIAFTLYKENSKWKVLNYNSSKEETVYGTESYHYIDFKITVKRQAASHATYVTQTTLALMLTVLVSYFLPLHYHLSRLLLHLFALSILILCNFVLFFSLPSSGGDVPFVVRYFSGTIILTTMSLICNVALTTTLSNDGSSQSGVTKKLSNILGMSNVSFPSRTQSAASNEVAYSNLEEELRDMSENSFERSNHFEETPPVRSTPEAATVVNKPSGFGIFRLVNVVLFLMFSIAYVVDYIVLKSSIGP